MLLKKGYWGKYLPGMIISIISWVPLFCWLLTCPTPQKNEWGFWGHRKINFMAVFTLPEEMLPLFKKEILYLSEHAVDADKRRYAAKEEAIRHYIDLDHYPPEPPKHWLTAKESFTKVIVNKGDTLEYYPNIKSLEVLYPACYKYLFSRLHQNYYEYHWSENYEDSSVLITFELEDTLIQHGVVPYQVPILYRRLVAAMKNHEISLILRLAADIGHYIADAHVPLHTTSNYDGQLTDQVGLHAFWESRIPELFAEKEYDFFVGKAEYRSDIPSFMWQIVKESFRLVDSVIMIEKRLSTQYPSDRQYCYEERIQQTVRVPCPEYAALYQQTMGGMVQKRMQDAILAVGSIWYTAWVDAGQPDLLQEKWAGWTPEEITSNDSIEHAYKLKKNLGRPHPDSEN